MEDLDVSERNQRVALTVNKGIGFLSDDEMLSYFSPKVVWQIGHNRLEGHEGVLGIHHVAQLAYPYGAERPVRSVLADDVRVMVQHVNRARTNKGVDYDNEYVKIFEFDTDGKISAVWEYMDSLYASTAFSISKGTQSVSKRVVSPTIRTMFLELRRRSSKEARNVDFLLLSRTADAFSWLLTILKSWFLFASHAQRRL